MSFVNKLFSTGFACWFAISQAMFGMSAAYAQSSFIDVEPPLIEHNVVAAVEANVRQSFFANVVDDDELDSVTLYYRIKEDDAYRTLEMKRVSYSSTYIAHVPTVATDSGTIEYYIQARDKAGNRTVRGYAFSPLIREITLPAPEPTAVVSEATVVEDGAKPIQSRTVLYVLGALAVAGLGLALAGRDPKEPSSGPTPGNCPNDLCTITVTVGAP